MEDAINNHEDIREGTNEADLLEQMLYDGTLESGWVRNETTGVWKFLETPMRMMGLLGLIRSYIGSIFLLTYMRYISDSSVVLYT